MNANPYHQLTSTLEKIVREGKNLPFGNVPIPSHPPIPSNAPVAMIFSPHPDDECIIGGIALRLLRENQFRVINVAVTQGSHPHRQIPRLNELIPACQFLNFDLIQTSPTGLAKIKPDTPSTDPEYWQNATRITRNLLLQHQPHIILFPHELDQNSGHIGVNMLTHDALRACGPDFSTLLCETEFWSPMRDPNVLVEIGARDLGDMLTALSFHEGEVSRNPYHVRTPMWMIDNVRRGGEIVGRQGGTPPDFVYGTNYRIRKWERGEKVNPFAEGQFISAQTDICSILPFPSGNQVRD